MLYHYQSMEKVVFLPVYNLKVQKSCNEISSDLFSKLNKPRSLDLSSQKEFSSCLTICGTPLHSLTALKIVLGGQGLDTVIQMWSSNQFIIHQIVQPSHPCLQFRNKEMMWDHVKGLTQVQVGDISHSSFVHLFFSIQSSQQKNLYLHFLLEYNSLVTLYMSG